jgi:hypothetical protein
LVVERAEQVGGVLHIFDGQRSVYLRGTVALLNQLADGVVVFVTVGDGFLEDRRVRGQAADAAVDQVL